MSVKNTEENGHQAWFAQGSSQLSVILLSLTFSDSFLRLSFKEKDDHSSFTCIDQK